MLMLLMLLLGGIAIAIAIAIYWYAAIAGIAVYRYYDICKFEAWTTVCMYTLYSMTTNYLTKLVAYASGPT